MAPQDSLRERKKQRTRTAIARAALELFSERGFEQVTMTDVALVADVAPRTLYRYYRDKEELLFGDDDTIRTRLRVALAERPHDEPPARAAVEATLSVLHLWDDRHAEGRARRAVITGSPALRARERAKHADYEQDLAEALVSRGLDEGAARLLARATVGCLAEALDRWLSRSGPAQSLTGTARDVFAELVDLLATLRA